jgi:hypothetical protein
MLPKAEVSSRHWGCARDCLHADAAIGVSYHDVAGTNTMTETVAVGRPQSPSLSLDRDPKSLRRVSASALALHRSGSNGRIDRARRKARHDAVDAEAIQRGPAGRRRGISLQHANVGSTDAERTAHSVRSSRRTAVPCRPAVAQFGSDGLASP